jgi:carbon storage regulator
MLVLSRKIGETIHIGDEVRLTVVAVQGNRVRLAFEAPPDVVILRGELCALEPAGGQPAAAGSGLNGASIER